MSISTLTVTSARPTPFMGAARHSVHPALVCAVSAAGLIALPAIENNTASVPFAAGVVGILAVLIFAVSKRFAFSVYCAWALSALVVLVSAVKYKMKGFSLHFYDAYVVTQDPEMIRFLADGYMHVLVPVLLALGLAVLVGWAAFRLDVLRVIERRIQLESLAVCIALLVVAYPSEAKEQRFFYYLQGRHLTAFFISLLDLGNIVMPGAFETRLADLPPAKPMAAGPVNCGDAAKSDVYVILAESQTNPLYYPELKAGPAIAAEMQDAAGTMRPLQVEMFGGGTWISNLSLMTGLSATDFGWRSPYLTLTLEGRVQGALPQVFAACGYRTAAIMPMNYSFVNEGAFLSSIGFETVLDRDAIGAPSYHLRDKFYFDAAEKFIEEHRASDGRPLFLLVQTMFPHSPYHEPLEPGPLVGEAPLSADPEMAEYLRRIRISAGDLKEFVKGRETAPDGRSEVFLTFGDHQVFATKPFVEAAEGAGALSNPRSIAYRTFYAIKGAVTGESMDDRPPVDIAFLGSRLLDAMGISDAGVFDDLVRLDRLCHGRFHLCPNRAEIDLHLRRRVDGGQLDIAGR